MVRALALVAFVVALSGCADLFVEDGEPPSCSLAPAAPFSADEVLEALHNEGLSMELEEDSAICAAEGVVAEFGNPEADPAREGFVFCGVREEPLRSSKLQVERISDEKTNLWVENVECTIYPDGDDEARQVARLRRALEKLEATL